MTHDDLPLLFCSGDVSHQRPPSRSGLVTLSAQLWLMRTRASWRTAGWQARTNIWGEMAQKLPLFLLWLFLGFTGVHLLYARRYSQVCRYFIVRAQMGTELTAYRVRRPCCIGPRLVCSGLAGSMMGTAWTATLPKPMKVCLCDQLVGLCVPLRTALKSRRAQA